LETQKFVLKVAGLVNADVEAIGGENGPGGEPVIEVGPDQTREVRVLVTTHQRLEPGASIPLTFTVTSKKAGTSASAVDHFLGP